MVDNNVVTRGPEKLNPVFPLGATVHYSIIQHWRRLYRAPTRNRIDGSRCSISNANFTELSVGSNMEVLFPVTGNPSPVDLPTVQTPRFSGLIIPCSDLHNPACHRRPKGIHSGLCLDGFDHTTPTSYAQGCLGDSWRRGSMRDS